MKLAPNIATSGLLSSFTNGERHKRMAHQSYEWNKAGWTVPVGLEFYEDNTAKYALLRMRSWTWQSLRILFVPLPVTVNPKGSHHSASCFSSLVFPVPWFIYDTNQSHGFFLWMSFLWGSCVLQILLHFYFMTMYNSLYEHSTVCPFYSI